MKAKLLIALLIAAAVARAASLATQPVALGWTWRVNPADLAGLSTNDYLTNIVFTLWTATNAATPVSTNFYTIATNWPASATPTDGAGRWSNIAAMDGQTRFYLLTVGSAGGGRAPFSNLASWVARPAPGVIDSAN